SIVAAAVIAQASEEMIQLLRQFAGHVGLAFQIKDDILDVEGKGDLIGKDVGSDMENGKSTYVSLTSLDEAKVMLNEEIEAALAILEELPYETSLLAAITDYVKERQA
ncbi:MAG: polyprenyl synthetase family protein, partial [Turicibacter sp.]